MTKPLEEVAQGEEHQSNQTATVVSLPPPAIEATEDAPPPSFGNGNAPLEDVLINEEAENQRANRELRRFPEKICHWRGADGMRRKARGAPCGEPHKRRATPRRARPRRENGESFPEIA